MQLGESIDNRSSRVVLALGSEAIAKMSKYNVGIIGLSPTGSEIIKNLILTGIGQIEINDSQNITNLDVGSNFFSRDSDILPNQPPKKRIDTIPKRLWHLNRNCKLTSVSDPVDDKWMSKFDSIILAEIRPFSEILRISNFCHNNNKQFIFAATVGPNAVLFEDFGDNFSCNNPKGEPPLEAHVNRIRKVNENESILQIDKSEVDIKFPVNSTIRFEGVEGMPQVNDKKAKILKLIYHNNDRKNPFEGKFSIDIDTSKYKPFNGKARMGKVYQVLDQVILNHKPIGECLSNPPSNAVPDMLPIRDLVIAISQFWDEKGRPPRLLNIEDADELCKKVNTEKETPLLKKSAMLFSAEYPPTVGMIGGCASMECIKYCTGLALPTKTQWVVIDRSCVISWEIENLPKINGSRYDTITATVGNKIQEKLRTINALIVGVGAIGCEYARYAALFGFNRITLIDNDIVELSNLTRQFLFRDKHQGLPKATVGRLSILKVNSDLVKSSVVALQKKFCSETVLEVGRDFDIVFSAVDSAIARNNISDYSAARRIPMVNAGMEKYTANFGIYVPFKTQKASFSKVQKEEVIPCTLKTIPTTPYHLLQWAYNEFISDFKKQPEAALCCIEDVNSLKKDGRKLKEGVDFLMCIPKDFAECVQWAFDAFTDAIEYHPQMQLQGGQMVTPHPFDITNKWHKEFLMSAALLKAKVHGLNVDANLEFGRIEETVKKCVKKPNTFSNINFDKEIVDVPSILAKFNSLDIGKISKEAIIPIDFDKDNEEDIGFIEGFSRSRAEVFSIFMDTFSKLKIMKVVGSIAPTLATTTAVAGAGPFSGFPMLYQDDFLAKTEEDLPLFQLASRNKLFDGQLDFRSIQLSFSKQFPAPRKKLGNTDKKFSVWDTIDVDDNPTFKELFDRLMKLVPPDFDIDLEIDEKFISYSDDKKDIHIVDYIREMMKYDDDFYLLKPICIDFGDDDDDSKVPLLPFVRIIVKHD